MEGNLFLTGRAKERIILIVRGARATGQTPRGTRRYHMSNVKTITRAQAIESALTLVKENAEFDSKWNEVAEHAHVHPDERSRTAWRAAAEV